MIHLLVSAWTLVFYQPLYNGLIFLVSEVPFHDVGVAIIILTIIVKIILFPVTRKSIVGQIKLKGLEGEISKIKASGASKEEQAKQTFALYKINKVNPFSSCLLILIQLPILIALYLVFFHGFASTEVALYSFVQYPEVIHYKFLGLFDLEAKNIILALLAGITQFLQVHFSPVIPKSSAKSEEGGFKADMARTMQLQMKYLLPLFIIFASYRLSAAVALYWTVNNITTIIQELLIRRRIERMTKDVIVATPTSK